MIVSSRSGCTLSEALRAAHAAAISAATLATTAARRAASSGRAVKRATPSRPAARRLMGLALEDRAQSISAALQAPPRRHRPLRGRRPQLQGRLPSIHGTNPTTSTTGMLATTIAPRAPCGSARSLSTAPRAPASRQLTAVARETSGLRTRVMAITRGCRWAVILPARLPRAARIMTAAGVGLVGVPTNPTRGIPVG